MTEKRAAREMSDVTLFALLVLGFVALWMASLLFGWHTRRGLFVMSWAGVFVFAMGMLYYARKAGTLINPFSFFWLSFFLFSFGQLFLYALGLRDASFDLTTLYPRELLCQAGLYYALGAMAMLVGSVRPLSAWARTKDLPMQQDGQGDAQTDSAVLIVALLMLCVSAPVFLSELSGEVRRSALYGYKGIYYGPESGGSLVQSLSTLFMPAVFLLLVRFRDSRIKWAVLLGMLLPVLWHMVYGSRNRIVAVMASVVFLWHAGVRPFSRREKSLLLLLGVFATAVMSIIASYRGQPVRSGAALLSTLLTPESYTAVLQDAVGEMGASMQIWLRLQHLVPNPYPFRWGMSYLASMLAIIPSFLLGGYSFAEQAQLSKWITNVESETYGLGFSMLGEAYYNFGWGGLLFIIPLADLVMTCLASRFVRGPFAKYRPAFSAAALYIFILLGRSSLYLMLRSALYGMLLPWLAIRVVAGTLKRRRAW